MIDPAEVTAECREMYADYAQKAGQRLGGIRTDRMNGDNLAIILCSYFDNPDQQADDETGWTPDGIAGCDEVLAAIRAHYEIKT